MARLFIYGDSVDLVFQAHYPMITTLVLLTVIGVLRK